MREKQTMGGNSFLIFGLLMIIYSQAFSANPDKIFKNKIYKPTIKTVKITKKGWRLSYPVMQVSSNNSLVLSFDELSSDIKDYSYTLIHCTADWKQSNLVKGDYIQGFTSADISDYESSFNTLHDYIHYEVHIPNRNMKPTKSGNYIIKVYKNYNPDSVILTRRFSLFDKKVNIETHLKRPTLAKNNNTGQELDFSVNTSSLRINDPYNEVNVVIKQNNRWDKAIVGLKPKYVRGAKLIYDFEEENVFKGGNEFRYFGMQSLRFQSEQVKDIVFARPYYHVQLRPDISRKAKSYSYHEDLNGKYYIDVQESEKNSLEADYVFVHFSLKRKMPLPGARVYVAGALSNWQYNSTNRMRYNPDNQSYECVMMLKQGYYNYEYVIKRKGRRGPNNIFFEGSHYQTENDYLIYVYHSSPSQRYDRLIGYKKINSLERL